LKVPGDFTTQGVQHNWQLSILAQNTAFPPGHKSAGRKRKGRWNRSAPPG